MAVRVGSARIDERGKIIGGKAGDQTGKEVSTQNWYKHIKGWVCVRPKDASKAALIAVAMKAACANNKIGYDQGQRLTLYNAAKAVGFDPAKVTTAVETDCSALVRVCCAFAGITMGNFTTANQVSALRATGEFDILTGSKHTAQSAYLRAGDILVTKTQGHTVVVLTDGPKAYAVGVPLGARALTKGDSGIDVEALQGALARLGHDPRGIDGEYGSRTETAVRGAQKALGMSVTGKADLATIAAIQTALGGASEPDEQPEPEIELTEGVRVTGGTVNVRTGPGTEYAIAAVVKQGDTLEAADADGWHPVLVGGDVRWISGKMSEAVGKG